MPENRYCDLEYKFLTMITYVLQSNGLLNIGKTTNILKRLKQYSTHNHSVQLLRAFDGDHEYYLHEKFKKFRPNLTEWFRMSVSEIDKLDLPSLNVEDVLTIGNRFYIEYFIDSNEWVTINKSSFNYLESVSSKKERVCALTSTIHLNSHNNSLPITKETSATFLSKIFDVCRENVHEMIDRLIKLEVLKKVNDTIYFNPYLASRGNGTCQSTMELFNDSVYAKFV